MFDPTKAGQELLYHLYWTLANILWRNDRVLLVVGVTINNFKEWIQSNVGKLTESIAGGASYIFGFTLTLAILMYAAAKLLALLFPHIKMPASPSKLALFTFLAGAFFASPATLVDTMEAFREDIVVYMQTVVSDPDLNAATLPGAFNGQSEPAVQVAAGFDNQTGVSGLDIAAGLLSLTTSSSLASGDMPPEFTNRYYSYGPPADFSIKDDAERTNALQIAADGITTLLLAPPTIIYGVIDQTVWLILQLAVLFLVATLPLAFALSTFNLTETLLNSLISRYINIVIQSVLAAVMLGMVNYFIRQAVPKGAGLVVSVSVIGLLVSVWMLSSAVKLLTNALDSVGGNELTGGPTFGALVNKTAGLAVGAAGLAAGVGGFGLIAASSLSADETTQKAGGIVGGFMTQASSATRGAVQFGQMARVMTGRVDPDDPAPMDFAYVSQALGSSMGPLLTMQGMGGMGKFMQHLRPSQNADAGGADISSLRGQQPPAGGEPPTNGETVALAPSNAQINAASAAALSPEDMGDFDQALNSLVGAMREAGASISDVIAQLRAPDARQTLSNALPPDHPLENRPELIPHIVDGRLNPHARIPSSAFVANIADSLAEAHPLDAALIKTNTYSAGPYTALAKNIANLGSQIQASPQGLNAAYQHIARGQTDEAFTALTQHSAGSPQQINNLIRHLQALPPELNMPQTTAFDASQLANADPDKAPSYQGMMRFRNEIPQQINNLSSAPTLETPETPAPNLPTRRQPASRPASMQPQTPPEMPSFDEDGPPPDFDPTAD